MVDGETLAKGWIWIFTGVGAFFALRGMWRRRRGRQEEPPRRKET